MEVCNRYCKPIIPFLVKNTLGLVNSYLLKKYNGDTVANSDVVIVLLGKQDRSGSLSFPSPMASFRLHNQNHTTLIYKTVSSIQDINSIIDKIKERNNRIRGLWIHAHGNANNIVLGPNQNLSEEASSLARICNENTLPQLQPSLQKLEDKAVLLLRVCETGLGIAEKIAKLAPGKLVIAPKTISTGFSFRFAWKDDLLSASFIVPKKINANNILERAYNVYLTFLYVVSWGYYGEDLTARCCVPIT